MSLPHYIIHTCILSLYDSEMDTFLWQDQYISLTGDDARIQQYIEQQVPSIMEEFDYDYSRNDLDTQWFAEEVSHEVPVLHDGNILLLENQDCAELELYDGILDTLEDYSQKIQSQRISYFNSNPHAPSFMHNQSRSIQSYLDTLVIDLSETYLQRYDTLEELKTKESWKS